MDIKENQEFLFKVLVVGDVSVGKTSLIKRYVHNIFSPNYKATIGVDFALKAIPWNDNIQIRLQMWDIAGEERTKNMTRVYYKDAHGAIVIFDVTKGMTFEAAKKWQADIDAKTYFPNLKDMDTPIPVLLVANKIDMYNQEIECDYTNIRETLDNFCKEQGYIGWAETSAKDGMGIDTGINFLVKNILEIQLTAPELNYNIIDQNPINLSKNENMEKNTGCC